MTEWETTVDWQQLSRRSLRSLMVLVSKSAYMQVIAVVGFLILSYYLEVEEIGIFYAVNEAMAVIGYFSDIGLAAALIQRKQMPSLAALRTSFAVQQTLVLGLSAGLWWLSPKMIGWYDLPPVGLLLLRALIVAFALNSLKTIPTVILERQLKFEKLVLVETVEMILFYLVAVAAAIKGWGVASYAWAVLARSVVGVALIYWQAWWPVGLAFDLHELRQLLKFGLPYQGNSLIAVVKDRLLVFFLFKLIKATGMGIIGWAQTWSQKPLRFVTDNVTKVAFPAIARVQDQPDKLSRAVNQMLLFTAVSIFPVVVGMGLMVPELMAVVPRYQKWLVAVPVFYLYLVNTAWAAISTPVTNILAAVGKIKWVSGLMVMWTVLTWLIILPAAYFWGYMGVAWGTAIVSFSSVVPLILLRRVVKFDPVGNIVPPLVFSAVMAVAVELVRGLRAWWQPAQGWQVWLWLAGQMLVGAMVYLILVYRWKGDQLKSMLSKLLVSFRD